MEKDPESKNDPRELRFLWNEKFHQSIDWLTSEIPGISLDTSRKSTELRTDPVLRTFSFTSLLTG
jgi:hypothetical protein